MGVYKWKDGARFRADAELVASELESLPQKTAECALEFADANTESELHKCVTWDDARAAHLYRLEEMRSVIRSVIVIDEAPDRKPVEYRAYEYVTVKGEGEKPVRQFMPTSDALSNTDFRSQVLGDIKRSIGELSRKAKVYRYLAETELSTAQHHLEMANEAVTV
jgi:hypothetical protein